MTAETEKLQWLICPYCGRQKILKEKDILYLMSQGMNRSEAEQYGRNSCYMICPNTTDHTNIEIVPLANLEHGDYYHGKCRNATIARWNQHTQLFTYMRQKFKAVFPETVKYWMEGHTLDEFKPFGVILNPPFEIPIEG